MPLLGTATASGLSPTPSLGPHVLPREALEQRICDAVASGHALLVAPTGYGKRTLMRCAAERLAQGREVIWFNHDRHLDDLQLLTRLCATVGHASAAQGDGEVRALALGRLSSASSLPLLAADLLVRHLVQRPLSQLRPLIFIDRIDPERPQLAAVIEWLLTQVSPQLGFVIASEPGLAPCERWQSLTGVETLGAGDLQFLKSDQQRLIARLKQAGFSAPTEAPVPSRDMPVGEFLLRLHTGHAGPTGELWPKYFGHLDITTQNALTWLVRLAPFDGGLAEGCVSVNDSAKFVQRLKELATDGLVLQPLDLPSDSTQQFQITHWAEAGLRASGALRVSTSAGPDTNVEVDRARNCVQALSARGRHDEAFALAHEADLTQRLYELVAEHATDRIFAGQLSGVARWLACVPESAAPETSSELATEIVRIWTSLYDGRLSAAEVGIDTLRQVAARRSELGYAAAIADVLEVSRLFLGGQLQRSVQLGTGLLTKIPTSEARKLRSTLGFVHIALGEIDTARSVFRACIAQHSRANDELQFIQATATVGLATSYNETHEFRTALHLAEKARALAEDTPSVTILPSALARVEIGRAQAGLGRLDEAQELLDLAIEQLYATGARCLWADGYRAKASVLVGMGDLEGARELLHTALTHIADTELEFDRRALHAQLEHLDDHKSKGGDPSKTTTRERPNLKPPHLHRPPRPEDSPLSARELEVLQLAARGASNREIAHSLHVSLATVKTHLYTSYKKLSVGRRTAAIDLARSKGWI